MKTIDLIREKYQSFFEKRGHIRVPSALLVPENDPTTLFTGSGMQPMVPYLLGQTHPLGRRLVNGQKCFRASDVEEVGDSRHTTFFEMLGNWSLGDYFKEEQLRWIFEFLTQEVGLEPSRLYITVFAGADKLKIPRDEESAKIWQRLFQEKSIEAPTIKDAVTKGLQGGRIFYYDETKNWWSRSGVPNNMPVGEPGGPDSEIFWDFGKGLKIHENSAFKNYPCHVNCDCGRFLEIGNSVFMEFIKTDSGFSPLPQRNVDFGGGLERMAAAASDQPDIFLLDVFSRSREQLELVAGVRYQDGDGVRQAFRVILDHVRASVFLIADGVRPANKDRGYFVRRLIRRATRFAHQLGISEPFMWTMAEGFIAYYEHAYPELSTQKVLIKEALEQEEKKFRATLRAGLKKLHEALEQAEPGQNLAPTLVFDLYQSYGFPVELTEEIAKERNFKVDRQAFEVQLRQHQQQSRQGADKKFKGGLADHSEQSVRYHTATHLLHQALRQVLGTQAVQRGSNITPERLRFDFAYPKKMTTEEIAQVEKIVNQKIEQQLPVHRQEMSVAEAKAQGALGLFEGKYGDRVSVYAIGDFSQEICGGPHVSNTSQLGYFKIVKEEASGGGVRRIKAILSPAAKGL